MNTADVLKDLGLEAENSGAFNGTWLAAGGELLDSINPATGEKIASVRQATAEDYETIAQTSAEAFEALRTWPAPLRGEIVRQLGEELRKHKDALGALVTMEMGKIASEGLGEVQEMIDMADLAVGMSRQLYGRSDHALRAFAAPDVRAVAPARGHGHHHRVQLPRTPCGRGMPWSPRSPATP